MNIEKLRKIVGREEVDYQMLLSALSNYSHPRDKITRWLKSEELIRVKKGLYVFGEEVAIAPYSLELLANLIYGPSAISLSYALHYYGFIPERVTTITSITNKRNKLFTTPVGEFTYRYLSHQKYAVGLNLIHKHAESSFFMASAEKALCDHIHLTDKSMPLVTLSDVEHYLFDDMRIDKIELKKLRMNKLKEITTIYNDPRIDLMCKFIKEKKQNA